MLFAPLFAPTLLALSAVALPSSKERFEKRVAMRNGAVRASRPLQTTISNTTHEEFSTNWAGAVLNAAAVRFTLSLSLTSFRALTNDNH